MRGSGLLKKGISYILIFSLIMSVSFIPQQTYAAGIDAVDAVDVNDAVDVDVDFQQVENSLVNTDPTVGDDGINTVADNGIDSDNGIDLQEKVRVAILLEKDSVIDKGYDTAMLVENGRAMNYRQTLLNDQAAIKKKIEKKTGANLDVQWNLSLLANMISADVARGDIEKIKAIDGVKDVLPEAVYYPDVLDESGDVSVNTVFSSDMVDVKQAWQSGYTGAGRRIAIIDTGLDTDHQSVSDKAYQYALQQNANAAHMSLEDYKESLDLLTVDEIESLMDNLNVKERGATEADKLYINGKIPYGYSYASRSYDVTHDNGYRGAHGSHVAGIAAANRFVEKDGNMVNALEETLVTGVAPDAQLLVMDVFSTEGAGGGDILAAIEDAILLQADTINMSLGTSSPGFADAQTLGGYLEKLKKTATVAVMSAGNNADWAYYSKSGNLYADDVNTFTMGDPGSGTESMSVASVENTGKVTSGSLKVAGNIIEYNELFDYSETPRNTPIIDMDKSGDGSGTDYGYVYFTHLGYAEDFEGYESIVNGKVVLCSRGDSSFSSKANNALAAGAAAVIIYNNDGGTLNMDLSALEYDAPVVSITRETAKIFKDAAAEQTGPDGKTYYAGTIHITNGRTQIPGKPGAAYEMSFFSSWGVTGDLALKPEVAAPGGNIYSIDGSRLDSTSAYTSMSGTSMAAPQVSGVVSLINEYVADKNWDDKYEATGFVNPRRGLASSILMSTAVPIKDADGHYYPLMQQGAGMANAAAATSADSYIKMDKAATVSYDDGKVKAELGDDPERRGEYTFMFSVNNLDGREHIYDLSADVFVQDHFKDKASSDDDSDDNASDDDSDEQQSYQTEYMARNTVPIGADVQFVVDGKSADAVTVAAGGSKNVTVKISLTDAAKAEYLEKYFPNGTYIQSYVFAKGRTDSEGNSGTLHSVPMLAFYGNWTDSPMFYAYSTEKGQFAGNFSTPETGDRSRDVYFEWLDGETPIEAYNGFKVSGAVGTYSVGGNPIVPDEKYMPERNAVSTDIDRVEVTMWLARNAFELYGSVKGEGKTYAVNREAREGGFTGGYLNNSGGGTGVWNLDMVMEAQPKEGDVLEFVAAAIPEYYKSGKPGFGREIGEGAYIRVSVTADGTAPTISDIKLLAKENLLKVTAQDNNYVAAVVLYNELGDEVLKYTGAKQEIEKGAVADYSLLLDDVDDADFYIQVFDYAGNVSTYRFSLENANLDYAGAMLAFDTKNSKWVMLDKNYSKFVDVAAAEQAYTAAAAVGDKIYAAGSDNKLYRLSVAEIKTPVVLGDIGCTVVDMAYNAADGELYGVTDDSRLVKLDTASGGADYVSMMPVNSNTLACAPDGTFYCSKIKSGEVYAFDLQGAISGVGEQYDFSGDGWVNADDCHALLNYVVSGDKPAANVANGDVDGDGDIDTHDVYVLYRMLDSVPRLVAEIDGLSCEGLQALEVDPNNGKIYWASYYDDYVNGNTAGFATLYEIDPDTGDVRAYTDYVNRVTCLLIFDRDAGATLPPVNKKDSIKLNRIAMFDQQGMGVQTAVETGNAQNSDAETGSAKEVNLRLVATDTTTNGMQTVSYDGNLLQLKAVSADGIFAYDSKSGVVKIGYVPKETAKAGDELAVLTFTVLDGSGDADFIIKEIERNNIACGNGAVDSETAKNLSSHNWGEWQQVSASNCGSGGLEDRICQDADCGKKETRAIAATGKHSWGEWQTVVPATDTTPGKRTRECGVCGEVEEDTVHINGVHNFAAWEETLQPTCGRDGEKQAVCRECREVVTLAVPASGEHQWGEWSYGSGENAGKRSRTCAVCGDVQTKAVIAGREGAAVDEEFNFFKIGKHLINDVEISGARVNRVLQLAAEPEDGETARLHYLIELSQYANDVDEVHAEFRVSEYTVSGIGSAFLDKKQSSVRFEDDVTDYDIDISEGYGSVEAWSMWEDNDDKFNCVAVELEFVIADDGDRYTDPYAFRSGDGFLEKIMVWDVQTLKTANFVSMDKTALPDNQGYISEETVYIWLAEDTPDDATVGINLRLNGKAVKLPDGWTENGGYVTLKGGKAEIEDIVLDSNAAWDGDRTFKLYIKNTVDSTAPELLQGSRVDLRAESNIPVAIDLTKYFADKDGDTLSYKISVNGGESRDFDRQVYRFTPADTPYVLTVTASDGKNTTNPCTITVTPQSGHIWGDWESVMDVTCLSDGTKEHSCMCCGYTERETVKCSGKHSWGEWHNVINEVGGATGNRMRQCTACNLVERESIQSAEFRYGDLDNDGQVSIIDVILLMRYLNDTNDTDDTNNTNMKIDMRAADVNADGTVSADDLNLLRLYLAGYKGVTLGKAN